MDQAENLRKIMQQKEEQAKEAARVIAVTSGKGGVGKSSVSVNLAIQFARMGKSVVILDADFGLANVEVMFGVIPKYNLSDLLYNGRELKEIICEGPEGIQFISGGSGIANLANFDKEQVKRLINKMTELEKIADIVIIDTGAGINPSVMEFLISSPETILVTTPEPTSVTDSYALLKSLSITEGFRCCYQNRFRTGNQEFHNAWVNTGACINNNNICYFFKFRHFINQPFHLLFVKICKIGNSRTAGNKLDSLRSLTDDLFQFPPVIQQITQIIFRNHTKHNFYIGKTKIGI